MQHHNFGKKGNFGLKKKCPSFDHIETKKKTNDAIKQINDNPKICEPKNEIEGYLKNSFTITIEDNKKSIQQNENINSLNDVSQDFNIKEFTKSFLSYNTRYEIPFEGENEKIVKEMKNIANSIDATNRVVSSLVQKKGSYYVRKSTEEKKVSESEEQNKVEEISICKKNNNKTILKHTT